ncbi:hypothetical protein BJX63DRAFT_431732 [Aspergillus granulosus]|uniref:Uncharacterized protein n=1 Tax=Aspergillus granulosus TaxID=176169 RepID=A0ABR4HEF9_9EURO
MTATTASIYRLGNLIIGKPITPVQPPYPAAKITQTEWTLHPGVYTPRQLVQGFAPLLDTVLHHLAPNSNSCPSSNPSRAQLLDNIAAILSTDTRESSLPFAEQVSDTSRQEIRDQARRIGQHLVKWATEVTDTFYRQDLILRSRCEGHLLTPPNVDLMFGRRSKPHLMQLYNEYMHQMVLLRDSLLPFHNYEDILIPVDGSVRGLRHMEGPREVFMAALFTRQVTQASIMAMARGLLAPGLPKTATSGYGLQYASGLVIPAVFVDGARPLHLLQYIPAHVDPSHPEILFEYEFADYYTAPRVEIPAGRVVSTLTSFSDISARGLEKVALEVTSSEAIGNSISQLNLQIEFEGGQHATVDVGQIARGYRYSYEAGEPGELDVPSIAHAAHDILLHPERGLVTSQSGGFHVIFANEPIIDLAVLGKLYPENIVRLSQKDRLERAVNAGKGFEPKFIVWA